MTQSPEERAREIDNHLDAVLKASGSALRHHTLPGSLERMRSAMSQALITARNDGLEEAAKVADRLDTVENKPEYDGLGFAVGQKIAAFTIATAIRKLKG